MNLITVSGYQDTLRKGDASVTDPTWPDIKGRLRAGSYFKFVANAPDGFNVAILRVSLYFLAQRADMDINNMPITVIIVAPDFIHQHFTSKYPVGRLRQQCKQVKLGRR